MFVDDNELFLDSFMMFASLLKDIECFTAKSGNEALKLFNLNSDISLIITDLKMPNGNGEELMLNIKSINPNVNVVAMTADELYNYSHLDKFNEVLEKPVSNFKQLITKYAS